MVGATNALPAVNSSEIFESTPNEIRERVRQLDGRAFTISDACSSGVFFPSRESGNTDSTYPVFSAS
jgi:hypothetical protein